MPIAQKQTHRCYAKAYKKTKPQSVTSGYARVLTSSIFLALPLTSELDALFGGNANRILRRFASRAQSQSESSSSRQPRKTKIALQKSAKAYKNQSPRVLPLGLSGAATRIRTGDLILTKDVLYQLSHSSIPQGYFLVTQIIISNKSWFVNTF